MTLTSGSGLTDVQVVERVEIIDAVRGSSDVVADSESLEIAVTSPKAWFVGAVACVLALIVLSADRGSQASAPVVPTTVTSAELIDAPAARHQPGAVEAQAPLPTTVDGGPAWPALPDDRDPSYVGRPGTAEPVRSFLVGKSLLYVNDYGRPTIVDFSTGDQREVLISEARSQDVFELEFGQIVTTSQMRSDLPASTGRSILVTGMRRGSEAGPEENSSIVLCIDGSGCLGETLALADVPPELDAADLLEATLGPEQAIARLLRVEEWSSEHRWTLFLMDPEDEDRSLKIPTPHPDAVLWLISQVP